MLRKCLLLGAAILAAMVLVGCEGPVLPVGPLPSLPEIRGVIAVMPTEAAGPCCGTIGVNYCRRVILLSSEWPGAFIETVRWEIDGKRISEGDNLGVFSHNFQATGQHHVRVTVVDELGRTVVFDGPFRVVVPRSDYSNPWYRY